MPFVRSRRILKAFLIAALVFCGAGAASVFAQSTAPQRPRITGIAHVGYYVSDLPKALGFWHDFLGYDESFALKRPGTDKVSVAFIKIKDHQQVELFTDAPPAPPTMMNNLCFAVDNVGQMRDYLRSKGIAVIPGHGGKTSLGAYAFEIKDPDGTLIEFVQSLPSGMEAKAAGKFLPATRIALAIYHVGFLVGNTAKSLAFYEDILGFKETWRGGRDPKVLSWINLRVPDGTDYVELMLYSKLPATYGSANHTSLVVPDIQKAMAELEARPWYKTYLTYQKPLEMHVGVNGKRQVNLFDPDGTRVELMEAHTADGKPVASSMAPPPPAAHD
ncbi:MAG TPA: VOC family protein [Terracidiphilus sp.]|nr:VOC family protein [Terracidiphilus sp.]